MSVRKLLSLALATVALVTQTAEGCESKDESPDHNPHIQIKTGDDNPTPRTCTDWDSCADWRDSLKPTPNKR